MIINWNAESNQEATVLAMSYLLNNCPTNMDPEGFSERFKPCEVKQTLKIFHGFHLFKFLFNN